MFFKQKYTLLLHNNEDFINEIMYTLTVPCGAKPEHLRFVRECCKCAGFGNHVSFVFEPVSAGTDILLRAIKSLQALDVYKIP